MKNYHGEAIFQFRTNKNIKQQSIAHALAMTRQNISKIEQNKVKISDENLEIVADVLGTTSEKIKNHKGAIVFDCPNHQGEQYNNCTISVPKEVLDALQTALKVTQDALKMIENLNKG
jgi:transcriptional regulator with XRE-family HTH domain